jgi:hypothetical protein
LFLSSTIRPLDFTIIGIQDHTLYLRKRFVIAHQAIPLLFSFDATPDPSRFAWIMIKVILEWMLIAFPVTHFGTGRANQGIRTSALARPVEP